MYKHFALRHPSERVLASISPANYTTKDGLIVVKNNARVRLYIDKTLLPENGIDTDRLELVRYNGESVAFIFEATASRGVRLTPIVRSPKLELSIPFSALAKSSFNPNELPQLRRVQCMFGIAGEKFGVRLPLVSVGK